MIKEGKHYIKVMNIFKKIVALSLCLIISFFTFINIRADSHVVYTASDSKANYGPGSQLLGGAEIMLVNGQTTSQMMSYVITAKTGEVIVVDGGLPEDADHLREIIKKKGNRVSAWFITHPHSDHVGAITKIINDGLGDMIIDGVYYNFLEDDWYIRNEAYRSQMVLDCKAAFEKLNPDTRHSQVKRGDVISIGDIKVNVLNGPYLFGVNSINNSSIAYRFDIAGTRVLFLGDMGPEAGEQLKNDVPAFELKSDIVQMAHHGQYGVNEDVYKIINPIVCMWNAPEWLWDNNNGSGKGSGTYLTLQVREWMDKIGVKKHYVMKDGDQIIK
jgi:putative metallo-beta-lactamase domain protein